MDEVDRHIEQWRVERPDLPEAGLRAMGLFGRLGRLAAKVGPYIEGHLIARHELTVAEFDVLAALRRAGEPFTLTPGALARAMMLSPSATTNRLDNLERRGLVTRSLDPGNRRSMPVTLTAEGRRLVDAAVVDHVATEQELLGPLSAEQIDRVNELLGRMLHYVSELDED
ncbi:MarR family winged helix-turn-helix transcriptional regulator [Pseudonocardia lacus]|uniref:MarR family winged helix-turn-helix transcriptional regulator n=1 Tax=Pseudonocardia lacus TaxID=2835865 RepID=UPI001BDD8CFC|nr:MarR family transcriptional regulator [Pseudonocardia lacus]